MIRFPATAVIAICSFVIALPAGAVVGDTGSYVERVESDGGREVKAWIEVAKTGNHFLTIQLDSTGVVRKVCADTYPVPDDVLVSPDGATDAVTTWTIELLKRKGHGRARTGFWNGPSGQRLASQLEAGIFPDKCE